MAKRYYKSQNDRMRAEKAGMIHEDPNAIANLPQQVKYEMYAKNDYAMGETYNDTISGVDEQERRDVKQMGRYMSDQKY